MHNPLAKLSPKLLDILLNDNFAYFVRQAYARGIDASNGSENRAFLFTHYRDKREAEAHFSSIDHDRFRKLYDCSRDEDRLNMEKAAAQPPGYHIYIALLSTVKWQLPLHLVPKIKSYIRNTCRWEANGNIRIELAMQFGELYLKLIKGHGDEIKVALSEIENS